MNKEKLIGEPPDELDGAKVISWAWSGDKPFGYISKVYNNSSEPIEIYGLAICQYADSNDIYRFSCDKSWGVQQDGLYESVDDAIEQLPDQYKLEVANWMTKRDMS